MRAQQRLMPRRRQPELELEASRIPALGYEAQEDAGLVRRFELDLVTHHCGESRTRHEKHDHSNEEGCMTRDAEGDATDREVHHVMTFLWRARRMFGRRAMGAGCGRIGP